MVSGGDPLGQLKKVAGQGLYREPREMLPDLGDTLPFSPHPYLPATPTPTCHKLSVQILKMSPEGESD